MQNNASIFHSFLHYSKTFTYNATLVKRLQGQKTNESKRTECIYSLYSRMTLILSPWGNCADNINNKKFCTKEPSVLLKSYCCSFIHQTFYNIKCIYGWAGNYLFSQRVEGILSSLFFTSWEVISAFRGLSPPLQHLCNNNTLTKFLGL